MAQEISLINARFALNSSISLKDNSIATTPKFAIGITVDAATLKYATVANLFYLSSNIDVTGPSPISKANCMLSFGAIVDSVKVSENNISGSFSFAAIATSYSDKSSLEAKAIFSIYTAVEIGTPGLHCNLVPHNSNRWT